MILRNVSMNLQTPNKFETCHIVRWRSILAMAYLSRNTLLLFMHAHRPVQNLYNELRTDRYFHTVSNWGKSTIFARKRHLLEESNMADKNKDGDKCMQA